MELYNKTNSTEIFADKELFSVLSIGDIPAAYLLTKKINEENPASLFNRALCMYKLEEYENAVSDLKRAEQLFGNPPEFDISERGMFIKALSISPDAYLLPLESGSGCPRYGLIRVRWLENFCLEKLGKNSEALSIKRFLSQYNINI